MVQADGEDGSDTGLSMAQAGMPGDRSMVQAGVLDGTQDDLTGLLTKNAGEKRILEEIAREAGALALIDVCNLKRVNDTCGHLAGDYVLKLVSSVLAEQADMISARYGGDQFVCFIRQDSQEAVGERLEAVMRIFEQRRRDRSQLTEVSLSIGVCMCRVAEPYERVLKNADRALYFAKQKEQGGCHFYSEPGGGDIVESSVDLARLLAALKEQQVFDLDMGGSELLEIGRYIRQLWGRSQEPVQMVMLTLQNSGLQDEDDLKKRQIMQYLNSAISRTIRSDDIYMSFSSDQYLLLLKSMSTEEVDAMVLRISQAFYKTYTDRDAKITYDVTEFGGTGVHE